MRWIFRILGAVVILIAMAIGALFLIPSERIASIAADQFETATGRAMVISGAVKPSIYPQLGVSIEGVEIANADWSDAGPMFTVERLRVGVGLIALMSGDIQVKEIEAVAPEILLEIASDGRVNWAFSAQGAATGTSSQTAQTAEIPAFTLDKASISSGSLRFFNHAAGSQLVLNEMEIEARLPDFTGPGTVGFAAMMNGQPFSIESDFENTSAFLSGAQTELTLAIAAAGNTINFSGQSGYAPLGAQGAVEVTLPDVPGLFSLLGQPAPAVPSGSLDGAGFSANMTYASAGTLHLRDWDLRVNQNRITGSVDLDPTGARPVMNANLNVGALDVTPFIPRGADESGAQSAGWSTDPIDVSALGIMDGRITVVADSINLGSLTFGASQITTTIDDRRAVFDLTQVSAYGGAASGEFIVNGRGGLSSRANLSLSGLSLEPLLSQLAGYERLSGTADARFDVLVSGRSMDGLMRSISGDGQFSIEGGELRGFDLAGMLRNLDASYEGLGSRTIFDRIGASFQITDGTLRNDDLNFQSPLFTATGAGSVGIGAQTLDYRVVPVALAGEDGTGGISVPVLITGTWVDPKFRPDLQSLLDAELEEERRALEERLAAERDAAEARLRQQAEEALGVTQQEGESTEDALRRGLEETVTNELLNLLGGN
ncbi:AsmA family protein [Cochlodiniinecator piscidefendens]|uniref:AsmA family protein n=1 Tax=Cochlodiniinecator piscidefendens TaxID=2715756 RepID=UPI00140807B6|nr:AsmA family protein [Cochlodiniinecator piscidefendens]